MTSFENGIEAIKKAADFAHCQGIDYTVTLNRRRDKFLVWCDTETIEGEFIERVRADVHTDV